MDLTFVTRPAVSLGLILGNTLFVTVFIGREWWGNEGNEGLAVTDVTLLVALGTGYGLTIYMNSGLFPSPNAQKPLSIQPISPLKVPIQGVLCRLKYCEVCRIYQPPRCVHCLVCDICIERFDHHCPWLGTCIGRKNYRVFLLFLLFLTIRSGFYVAISVNFIISAGKNRNWEEISGPLIAFLVSISLSLMVLFLFSIHVYLCSVSQTTYEWIKRTWKEYNPYSERNVRGNWGSLWC